jgi:fused signal recognition particle receptor
MGFFDKLFGKKEKETLDDGLQKTKEGFFSKISKAIAGKNTVDEAVLDDLEDALVSADVGIETTIAIIDKLSERVKRDKYLNTSELNNLLHQEMQSVLADSPDGLSTSFDLAGMPKPYVLLVVGVNGVGKTTTIGKLAKQFKMAGKSVLLGAADTFRAAAVDQLTIWSERVGVPARGVDIVIIDTAGRLHNKLHLMEELSKIKRVITRQIPNAPHEVLLVLDGSTGQNALEQAKQFTAATEVTGLAITKLDGTAKGGVVLAISHQMKIPVRYIGVGEKVDDLLIFNKKEFVNSIFSLEG